MLIQFQDYLVFENIYLWANLGVIPFWLLLTLFPNSRINQIMVNSVILPLILSIAYVYILLQIILLKDPLIEIFYLYLSLENLYIIFSTESFLLIFWLHFLAVNLFLGSWVSRDSVKYNISRKLVFIPLVLIYFAGPVGLVLYWFIRIFYSKKISLYD